MDDRLTHSGGRRGVARPLLLLAAVLALWAGDVRAEVFQSPEAFLSEVFAGDVPDADAVWLTDEVRAAAADILDHPPRAVRMRYWGRDGRTAWILEEIGKHEPITTGIVVDGNAVTLVRVLVYRETRGWEVRYPYFTDQFVGVTLTDARELDRSVDNIAGATLSVRSMRRMVRLALYLHSQTPHAAN